MALPFYNWSRTAASNANADSTVNWAEGQAPSSVNDSARAMMASTAAFRDDIAGAIVTGGTSTAYTLSSFQVFDTNAHMNGQLIAFTPHIANSGACTLNVDGLGAVALRSAPGVDLPSGTILQGTPYMARYNITDSAWYLHGFFGNPYNVPIASGMDYWAASTPNSSFAFCDGSQALSRTVYSTLFGLIGTTYGAGDGTTTFNLPDKRGRVSVAEDASAGRITGSVFSSLSRGGVGGAQNQTINVGNLPPYTPTGTITNGAITITQNAASTAANFMQAGGNPAANGTAATITASQAASSFAGNAQGGASVPIVTMPAAIVCKYIMRII